MKQNALPSDINISNPNKPLIFPSQKAFVYNLSNYIDPPLLLPTYFSIGKSNDCNLKTGGHSDHIQAQIIFKSDSYQLENISKKYQILVNGQSIQKINLNEGDEIVIGDSILQFSFNLPDSFTHIGLHSKNQKWNEELKTLGSVAKTDFPILIVGPTGAGKEVIGRAIHQNSSRNSGPLVIVNCCALSETIIESELFGHVRGSFTGAFTDRKGAFESARGGTLILDEIGDLPLSLQVKLLRAIDNQEIRPVGSDRTICTNVRIISSTNQNLYKKALSNEFRLDLYYRLNVVLASPPPLCQRMEDFNDLLYYFSKKMHVRFSYLAIQKLKTYNWPGNIRELKNVISRASAIFPKQLISVEHLNRIMLHPQNSPQNDEEESPASETIHSMFEKVNFIDETSEQTNLSLIKEMERQMILRQLAANHGNQRKTATNLGMPRSTLNDKIKFYNIDITQFNS